MVAGRVARSDGHAHIPLFVERLREVAVGITEEITVRNYSLDPVECVVPLSVEADFADLFEVKEARILRHWDEPGSRTQVRGPGSGLGPGITGTATAMASSNMNA